MSELAKYSDLKQALLTGERTFWDRFFREGCFARFAPDRWSLGLSTSQTSQSASKASVWFKNFFDHEFTERQFLTFELSTTELNGALSKYLDLGPAELRTPEGLLNRSQFTAPPVASFEKSFQLVQGKIRREEIEKAVPMATWRSTERPTLKQRFHWIKHMLHSHAVLYPYGLWNEESGICGATPEILFHIKDSKIHTMALAGTSTGKDESAQKTLLRDPKELREHNFVVDDLSQIFSRWGTLRLRGPQLLELPTLFHLMTAVEVEPRELIHRLNPVEMMKALHPTPALGVAPRAYGYHWMCDLGDQMDRELFGAPIAFQLPSVEQTLALVAIRSVRWNSQGTSISAGCGVVKDSSLEKEWAEIQRKIESIFSFLDIH